jgi:hypothetical protein
MSYTLKIVVDSTDGSIAGGTEVQDWTLNEVIVNHGRRSIDEDVPPSNASLGFIWDKPGALDVDDFVIGRRIQVWIIVNGYSGTPLCLFDGAVTDVEVVDTSLSVIAVNRALSEIGRQTVTLASQITDTVANALSTLYALGSQDPRLGGTQGTTDVKVEPFETENLLGIMREVASSEVGGYLTQSMPWGPTVVGFTTGPHVINRTVANRSQLTPDLTFTGDEILDRWNFSRRMEDFVNRVTVFGTEDSTDFPDGFWVEDNAGSIATYGLNELQIATRIRYENDAEALANDKLDRYYVNGWIIEQLTLLLGTMSAARLFAVLDDLNPDAFIQVPEIFTGAPTRFFVEGITFELARHDIQAQLYISTAGFSRGAQTWEQVTPTRTWAQVPATLTWTGSRLVEL